eukprot:scaffold2576_cov136-Isochrysis_galbana.AAC.3
MHERVINVKCTRPGFLQALSGRGRQRAKGGPSTGVTWRRLNGRDAHQRLINIVKRHLDAGRTNAPAFQPAMRSSEQHGAEMK